MPIAASLLPEFDHEMASTRTALERAPEGRASWKPHRKSKSLAELTTHIAEIPAYLLRITGADELDLALQGGEPSETPKPLPFDRMCALFDENVVVARKALAAATDEELMRPWSFKSGGHTIFTLPKVAAYRTLVMNHMLHHRGQLTVYLRLTDTPVPGLYGPSADEQ